MTQVGKLTIQMSADVARLQRDMAAVNKNIETSMQKVESRVGQTMNYIRGFSGVFATTQSVSAFATLTDNYTKFTAQLRLAADGQAEFNQAYSNTLGIAKTAQADVGSLGALYARLMQATKELGLSQTEVSNITETVALSLKVSGASAQESASAMQQLSQAFGSGVLRGEEFNAVNEAAPILMRTLADSIGVPVGALREMASEGELTSEVLAKAFKDESLVSSLQKQAGGMQTIGSAITSLKNDFTIFIGEFDRASGASQSISNAILGLSQNFDVLGRAAAGFLAVYSSKKILDIGGATLSLASETIAQSRASAFARDAAIAETAAKMSALQATQAAIAVSRAEAVEKLQSANAAIASAQAQIRAAQANGAYSASLLALRQAEVSATVASQARSIALAELSVLGQQAARVNAQLAASTVAAASSAGLAAKALGFLGGPIGAITTVLSLGATAWAIWGGAAENSEQKASNALASSTEVNLKNLDAQIDKIKLRNDLLARGVKNAGDDAQMLELSKITKQIDEVMSRGTINGSSLPTAQARQSVLMVLGGQYNEIQKKITEQEQKQLEIQRKKQEQKKLEYAQEYATNAEKKAAAIALAKKDLGSDFSPEIEMRIAQKFEPPKSARVAAKKEAPDWREKEMRDVERALRHQEKLDDVVADKQKKIADAQNKIIEDGARVFDQTRTPLESYAAEIERLQDLFNRGGIDADTFGRAVLKSKDAFENFGQKGKSELEELQFAIEGFGKKSADAFVNFALTGKASFSDLTNSVLADIARLMVQKNITDPLFKAISSSVGDGGAGGGFISSIASLFKFADGGIMTPYGPLKLNAYAGGGVVNSPQMYVAGEGSMNEAIIPLPDGRSVPVTMTGGQSAGAVNVEVNVINQGQPASARVVGQRQTSGGLSIDVLIDTVDSALGQRMSKGQGALANAVPRKFGLNGAAGNYR